MHSAALRYDTPQADRSMQFLVYLTVLMVSISTVLLEVHWLTSPPPQPKPAVHTAAATAPPPKVEGPDAALSPVYPKKSDASQPVNAGSQPSLQQNATAAPPAPATANSEPAQKQLVETQSEKPPGQKPPVETTGFAPRVEETQSSVPVSAPAAQSQATASNNHCDMQACSSAYKSFRASDCTYQPFEGERRLCEKPPLQRTAREQREEPQRRQWSRDSETRGVERRTQWRSNDDGENVDDIDDDADPPLVIHRPDPRW